MTTSAGSVAAGGRRTASGGASRAASPGLVDAVLEAAARGVDLAVELVEAAAAAAAGAVVGAGHAAAAVWVADRPRRQKVRQGRRKRWWKRKGWWRLLVALELVAVMAWVGARSAARVAWAGRQIADAGAARARTDWTDSRARRAQARTETRTAAAGGRAGEDVVDADVVCSWTGPDGQDCGEVLPTGTRDRYCTRHPDGRPSPAPSPSASASPEPGPDVGPAPDTVPVPASAEAETSPGPGDPGPMPEDVWTRIEAAIIEETARRAADDTASGGTAPVPARSECTWLDQDGRICGATDVPAGELFCPHHGTSSPDGDEEEDVLDRAHDRVGQRVRHLGWDSQGTVTGVWADGDLAVRFDDTSFTEDQCSPGDVEVISGPAQPGTVAEVPPEWMSEHGAWTQVRGGMVHYHPNHPEYPDSDDALAERFERWSEERYEEAEAARRRTEALRAAGWTGPIDPDGHAVHGEPAWAGLAGALAAIEQEATGGSCCRCVLDPGQPQWDQVACCRCVVGEGADRDSCTCGPWDLAVAIRDDDAAEDRGDIDGDDRATCHQCQDWADHAHQLFGNGRISVHAYRLQEWMRQHPNWRPPTDGAATEAGSDRPTEAPAGPVAGGSAGQHDQQDGPDRPAGPENDDVQEDEMGSAPTTEVMSVVETTTGDRVTRTEVRTGGPRAVSGGVSGGELTNVADLLAEVRHIAGLVEMVERMASLLTEWAQGLPEKVQAAPFSTVPLSQAAAGVAEGAAHSTGALRERLSVLLRAVTEAERLGDSLAAVGARGDTRGLTPQ